MLGLSLALVAPFIVSCPPPPVLQEVATHNNLPSSADEVRRLSLAMATNPELMESRWKKSAPAERVALLEAFARVFPQSKTLDSWCQQAFLTNNAPVYQHAIQLASFPGISPQLIKQLEDALDHTELTVASKAAHSLLLSGNASHAFEEPGHRKIIGAVLKAMLAAGETPQLDLADVCLAFPENADDILAANCERSHDHVSLSALLKVQAQIKAGSDRSAYLLDILLLNNERHPLPQVALRNLWLASALPTTADADANLYQRTLNRHIKQVNKSTLFPLPESTITPRALNWMFYQAPLPAVEDMLHALAVDVNESDLNRTKAILRLSRANGAKWSPLLLPILDQKPPATVKGALMNGVRPFLGADDLAQVVKHLPRMRQQAASIGLEFILRFGTARQREDFLPRVTRIESSTAQALCIRAAWEAEENPDFIELFKAWSLSSNEKVQALSRWSLVHVLTEKECADFYRERINTTDDTELLGFLLRNLRQLRTDAALEVMIDWLASSNGMSFSSSSDFASSLIGEESAQGMFQLWWQQRGELTPFQVELAAASLCPRNQQARSFLYRRFPQLDVAARTAFLSRLKLGAAQADFDIWQEWFLDPTENDSLRRGAALALAEALPDSSSNCLELLTILEDTGAEGLPSGNWPRLLTSLLATDCSPIRDEAYEICRRLEARFPHGADSFTIARHRAWRLNTNNLVVSDLLADAINGLAGNASNRSFSESLTGLADHAKAHGDGLLAAMQKCDQGDFDPDRMLALATFDKGLVTSTNHAKNWLITSEPLDSPRRASIQQVENSLPPHLWVDPGQTILFFEHQLGEVTPSTTIPVVLEAARLRWPQDRRMFNYSGWFALRKTRPEELSKAKDYFEASMVRSGFFPGAAREPILGLAILNQLRGQTDSIANQFSDDPDSRTLLDARLPPGLLPAVDAVRNR